MAGKRNPVNVVKQIRKATAKKFSAEDKIRMVLEGLRGEIVNAIEEYYAVERQYPELLKDLIPNYISNIKQPSWGSTGWFYEKEDVGFYLAVGYGYKGKEPAYPIIYYSYSQKGWVTDF